jgi:osmotically inducible protein OsmC
MMKRNASAVWRGQGATGTGNLTSRSGVLDNTPYSTKMRFEDAEGRSGTNPEELIAAAHAGCFTMATAFQLSGAGYTPEELSTDAELTMEKEEAGWTIKSIHLTLRGKVPGITAEEFETLAGKAKAGCPVSRALNADITLTASLAS